MDYTIIDMVIVGSACAFMGLAGGVGLCVMAKSAKTPEDDVEPIEVPLQNFDPQTITELRADRALLQAENQVLRGERNRLAEELQEKGTECRTLLWQLGRGSKP